MAWLEKFPYESDSKRGTFYTVGIKDDGTWGCSCPAWVWPRGGRGRQDCKHIIAVKAMTRVQRQELRSNFGDLQARDYSERARKAVKTRRERAEIRREAARMAAERYYQEQQSKKSQATSTRAVADLRKQITEPEKKKKHDQADPTFRLIDLPE